MLVLLSSSIISECFSHYFIYMQFFFFSFFFFNDTATTEIYTLSLHDALPISQDVKIEFDFFKTYGDAKMMVTMKDRKSTRLNSSHVEISYAVFCLKKKKKKNKKKLI